VRAIPDPDGRRGSDRYIAPNYRAVAAITAGSRLRSASDFPRLVLIEIKTGAGAVIYKLSNMTMRERITTETDE
jgi:hypothetical protein